MPPEAPTTREKQWPPQVEKVLRKLHQRVESDKSKLSRAIEDRDAWMMELRQMTKDRDKERLNRCADLVDALEEIKYRKFAIAQARSKMDKAMTEADQGKFKFADYEDADIPSKQLYFNQLVKSEEKSDEDAADAEKDTKKDKPKEGAAA